MPSYDQIKTAAAVRGFDVVWDPLRKQWHITQGRGAELKTLAIKPTRYLVMEWLQDHPLLADAKTSPARE